MPKKLTYEYVKEYIEKEGYVLLSTEYINSNSKLLVCCSKEHEVEMRFNDFKHGHRCITCGNIKKSVKLKTSFDDVKKYIEMIGYELISTNYNNNKEKIKLKCNNNHIFHMTFDNFKNGGQRCPTCSYTNRYNSLKNKISYIESKMNIDGCVLIDESYKNNHSKMTMKCSKNHTFKVSFNNFDSKISRCPICSYVNGGSNPEKEIISSIRSIYHGTIIENDRSVVKNYFTNRMLELDIYLPDLKKAIEFNGSYWHKNTRQQWKDEMKKKQCIQKSIDLLIINEFDWKKNKESVIQGIQKFLI